MKGTDLYRSLLKYCERGTLMKVDLIIISYKPDETFLEMVKRISEQTVAINRIIIYNVEQKFFDRIAYSAKFSSDYKNAEVHHISRREYDNGKTRNQAVKCSDADYFIMMYQDAVPEGNDLVEKLVKSIEGNKDIAVSFARQIEKENSREYAKIISRYFFPDDSYVRSIEDVDTYRSMAYQNSNVCAIYRRDIFDKLGGFVNHAIANEDVLYAATALNEGYKVAYASDAKVRYSYTSSRSETQKFFFDSAVSYVKHPEIFDSSEIIPNAKKIIQNTRSHLARRGLTGERVAFFLESRAMLKGLKLGKRYKSLSRSRILKLTANPGYWATDELLRDRSGVNARLGYGRSADELKMLAKPPCSMSESDKAEKDNS